MSQWVNEVNAFAEAWAGALWRACWQGGVAIALVWVVCRLFPKMAPRVRCWLWRLAFLKLLVTLVWATPINLPLLPAPSHRMGVWGYGSMGEAVVAPALTRPHTNAPPRPHSHTSTLPHSHTSIRLHAPSVLLLLWLLGVGWCATRLVRAWCATQSLRDLCIPVDDEGLNGFCAELCQRFRLRRVPRLKVSGSISTPMLLGVVCPAIVLPSTVLEGCTTEELRLVLAHELAHLKRRDLFWGWLPTLAHGLFFFHPLVWLAQRELRLEQETACDEMAVRVMGAGVGAYGAMLLKVAVQPMTSLQSGLVTVSVVESYQTLKRRLMAMKHIGSVSRRWLMIAGVIVAVLGIVSVVPWRIVAQESKVKEGTTMMLLRTIEGHGGFIFAAAFSPDGKMLACSDEGTVKMWDAQSGELLRTLSGAGKRVESIAFSPDGNLLASGSMSFNAQDALQGKISGTGNTMLWDVRSGKLLQTLPASEGEQVMSVAFSPDGKMLASAVNHIKEEQGSGEVRLWSVEQNKLIRTLKVVALCVQFSSDGALLACSSVGQITLWNPQTGKKVRTIKTGSTDEVMAIAFSPDGKTLASAITRWEGSNWSGELKLWDVQTGKLKQTLKGHSYGVRRVTFSPDGKSLASGAFPEVILWDAATGKLLQRLKGHQGEVWTVAFSPDGTRLASAGADGIVRLWGFGASTETGEEKAKHTKDASETAGGRTPELEKQYAAQHPILKEQGNWRVSLLRTMKEKHLNVGEFCGGFGAETVHLFVLVERLDKKPLHHWDWEKSIAGDYVWPDPSEGVAAATKEAQQMVLGRLADKHELLYEFWYSKLPQELSVGVVHGRYEQCETLAFRNVSVKPVGEAASINQQQIGKTGAKVHLVKAGYAPGDSFHFWTVLKIETSPKRIKGGWLYSPFNEGCYAVDQRGRRIPAARGMGWTWGVDVLSSVSPPVMDDSYAIHSVALGTPPSDAQHLTFYYPIYEWVVDERSPLIKLGQVHQSLPE